MAFHVCPFHGNEAVRGEALGNDGSLTYVCDRKGHPLEGPYVWLSVPEPPDPLGADGLAADLGLAVELPAAVAKFRGQWVEYGVVEHAYATARPDDFAFLVAKYGHNSVAPKSYTASAFLARTLGTLSTNKYVVYHPGPATGRWAYNEQISWWTMEPAPEWPNGLSWAETGLDMGYVPGSSES